MPKTFLLLHLCPLYNRLFSCPYRKKRPMDAFSLSLVVGRWNTLSTLNNKLLTTLNSQHSKFDFVK